MNALLLRNLRVYFRDKASVFFSLLSVLIISPSFWVLFTVACIAGFAIGGELPVWAALLAERFGSRSFGTVMGLMSPLNMGFNLITRYPRADYLCIDTPEARLATGEKRVEVETIAGELLPSMVKCDKLILTHGKYGCVTYAKGEPVSRIPALTRGTWARPSPSTRARRRPP